MSNCACGTSQLVGALSGQPIRRGKETGSKVESLDSTVFATGTIVEAIGAPAYVSDVSEYAAYGLTETGWYIFAKITGGAGDATSDTSVNGADGYFVTPSENSVSVAVRFDVASMSKPVVIHWENRTERFVFKATDLAVDRIWDYITETPAQGERF